MVVDTGATGGDGGEGLETGVDDRVAESHNLSQEQELRLEVGDKAPATLRLKSGAAEIFGSEIGVGQEIVLPPATKLAVFTWYGAQIEVEGEVDSVYVADDTPTRYYLNAHATLENRRKVALDKEAEGPRTLVVGPTDAGKSTLCKMLLNYATRTGWEPLFVDLDVGQGSITVPGSLAATPVKAPTDVNGFPLDAPLALYHGSTSPQDNAALYRYQVERLAGLLEQRSGVDARVRASGWFVNTMGWIEGPGFELLLHAVECLHIDVIMVIGHDRLYSSLMNAFKGQKIAIVKLQKSGGVVTRAPTFRRSARDSRVKEYFYGPRGELSPSSTSVSFDEWKIFRLGGGPRAPSSALPIGAKATADPVRTTQLEISKDLMHSVLAVTHAQTPEDLLTANVAGFVYVTDVDTKLNRISFLSPCPGALPSTLLISGSIKWYE